jgi:hypothetical protein
MASGTIGGLTDQRVFKVTHRFMVAGQRQQLGYHVRDVAVNDNDSEDVAGVADGWGMTNLRTLLLNTDSYLATDVIRLASDEGFTIDHVSTFGTKSVAGVAPLPSFLACQVALKTQRRKRYGQGRFFLPLRDENDVTGDSLVAAAVTSFQGVVDALTDLFTGDPVTHDLLLCNAHGVIPPKAATGSSPARPEIPPTWYDVDAVILKSAVTMLRSRKAGIGQ